MGKTASSGSTLNGDSGPGNGRSAFGLYNPGQNMFPLSQAQAAHTASCRKAFLHHWIPASLCFLHLVLGTLQGNGYRIARGVGGGGRKIG